MNPLFQMLAFLCSCEKRTCRACQRITLVPAGKRLETVKCRHCGEALPPLNP